LQLLLSFKRVEAGYKNNNNNNKKKKKKKKKKPGGIHPTAIGFTLRRLASKCANSFGTGQLKPLSTPISWALAFRAVVRLPFTLLDDILRQCQPITCS